MVTLRMSVTTDDGHPFVSLAHFKADSLGCVNVSRDQSHGGSYKGVDQMGLFTSLECYKNGVKKDVRFHKLDVKSPMKCRLELFEDQAEEFEDVQAVEECEVERWFLQPGSTAERLNYKRDGLQATVFLPPGNEKHPGVMVMFGGHPGLLEFKASLLASHGFVTMALAFHGPGMDVYQNQDDPSKVSADLDYFRRATDHLRAHERVSGDVIGLVAISFSVHLALLMSTYLRGIAACVCINGFIWNAGIEYRLDGRKLPRASENLSARYMRLALTKKGGERYSSIHLFPEVTSEEVRASAGFIDFPSRRDVAYMSIGASDDRCQQGDNYARVIGELLQNHPNHVTLIYEGAGHLMEPPYGPPNLTTRVQGGTMVWGGEREKHAAAEVDSWHRQIDFLRANLPPSTTSG